MEKIICENSVSKVHAVIDPKCWEEEAKYKVTVYYNELGTDKDTLLLCKNCMELVIKDAKKFGYRTIISRI